jgi:hypothetical protein
MKKLPLMLAVVFAIGLTSCGGDDDKKGGDKKDGDKGGDKKEATK